VRQPLPAVAAAYEYPQFSRIQHSPPIRPRAFMRPLELAVGCRMRRYLQLFVVPNLQEHPKQSCSAARTAPEPVDSVVGALRILGKGLFELLTYSHLKQLRYWDIPDLIMSLESEHSRSSNALRLGHTRSTSSASTSLSCDERPPAGMASRQMSTARKNNPPRNSTIVQTSPQLNVLQEFSRPTSRSTTEERPLHGVVRMESTKWSSRVPPEQLGMKILNPDEQDVCVELVDPPTAAHKLLIILSLVAVRRSRHKVTGLQGI
jgi:hypothetical protein